MRLSDLHKRILASEPPKLLLDAFPNAVAAYSLRKLRSAYTGNCIEVRRSSDNALQNIGFVNNELDTASLLSFVGAGNGFVRTWYDQSAQAKNAVATTNTRQPLIVSNGSLLTFNGTPNLLFNGTSGSMQAPSIFNNVGYGSIFAVHKQTSQTTERVVFHKTTSAATLSKVVVNYNNGLTGNEGVAIGGRRISTESFQAVGTQSWSGNELLSTSFFKWQEALLESYVNSTTNGSRVFQTAGLADTNTFPLNLGSTHDGNIGFASFFNGTIKEIVTYETDQSANKTGIENNINSYYSIYP
jgi:hypothetical protein